jgi:chromosome segregation ATPase
MTNTEYQQLVEFLGRRFAEIDRRFDRVEAKLAEHDEQFRDILAHFDELYRRLERLEQEYHAILQALRRIESLLVDEQGKREILERSVEELKRQVAALQARIEELEQRISE